MISLRQRMIEDMQVRNLSVNTQDSYIRQVSLFARHFNKSPELLGPEQIRAYQVYLTNERKLATGSILIAIAALRFLYKITLKRNWSLEEVIPAPKKPQKLPVVLSPEEVLQFLNCVRSRKHRAILTICYAAGLHISEAIALTPPAIDSKRVVIRVEQGKGKKDRYVMLSPKLLEILRAWWRVGGKTHIRSSPNTLFSCRLLRPRADRVHRLPEQRGRLRHSVSSHGRDLVHHRRRSQKSGSRNRLLCRTP